MAEIQAKLARRYSVTISLATIHGRLLRLGLRHNKPLRAAKQDRPEQEATSAPAELAALHGPCAFFVSLDETATAALMARRYGQTSGWSRPCAGPHIKVSGVRQANQANGTAILDLPPESADRKPVEHRFAKLKALLRKAAVRTNDTLWQAIGGLLAACDHNIFDAYFRHCNYGATFEPDRKDVERNQTVMASGFCQEPRSLS